MFLMPLYGKQDSVIQLKKMYRSNRSYLKKTKYVSSHILFTITEAEAPKSVKKCPKRPKAKSEPGTPTYRTFCWRSLEITQARRSSGLDFRYHFWVDCSLQSAQNTVYRCCHFSTLKIEKVAKKMLIC